VQIHDDLKQKKDIKLQKQNNVEKKREKKNNETNYCQHKTNGATG
jgi:hypothetical protein